MMVTREDAQIFVFGTMMGHHWDVSQLRGVALRIVVRA